MKRKKEKMSDNKKNKNNLEDLRSYLDNAIKIRNHEFNIQMIRNAVFTGIQAVLFGSFLTISNLQKSLPVLFLISGLGIYLSFIWWKYYKSSVFWIRYWEERCFEINSEFLKKAKIDVNLFDKHPTLNSEVKSPSKEKEKSSSNEVKRETLVHKSVHSLMKYVPFGFLTFWFISIILIIVAGCYYGVEFVQISE